MTCDTITNVVFVILAVTIVLNMIAMFHFWKSERAFKRSMQRLNDLLKAGG